MSDTAKPAEGDKESRIQHIERRLSEAMEHMEDSEIVSSIEEQAATYLEEHKESTTTTTTTSSKSESKTESFIRNVERRMSEALEHMEDSEIVSSIEEQAAVYLEEHKEGAQKK